MHAVQGTSKRAVWQRVQILDQPCDAQEKDEDTYRQKGAPYTVVVRNAESGERRRGAMCGQSSS